ncbi:MAG TPA: S1 RNA-binding domain-containing protein [Myxococcota bacterium]|nr:S1 RNA-binding domain-containing protein [Myxococcota bacterium]
MSEEEVFAAEDFEAMLNESFPSGDGFNYFQVGDKVRGTVVSVGDGTLLVDIGQRSEASIAMEDFTPEELAAMKVGDVIEANVVKFAGGATVLSRSIGGRGADMSAIRMAKEADLPIEAKVTGHNKGGFTVEIGPVRGFVPISQMEIGPALAPEQYIGRVFRFKVIEAREHEAVLSRASLLRQEMAEERGRILSSLAVGQTVAATVVKVEKFGVFVDIGGGVHALVPVSELGWHGRDEILGGMEPGRELNVEISRIEQKDGKPRISASLRSRQDDPWNSIDEVAREGMTVAGKVTRLMNFGAFVEIAPGIEGLVHVSEIAAGRRVRHPGDVLSIGQRVEASVRKIDHAARRIALSIKALAPVPEMTVSEVDPDAAENAAIIARYSPSAPKQEDAPKGETAFSLALKKARLK